MTAGPLLDVRDLRVAFRTPRAMVEAVRGISLSVAPGESLAVVGESGSGKSVTLRTIMGVLDSAGHVIGGDVLWNGQSLLTGPTAGIRGREISSVFQDALTALNPLFPVGAQVAEVLRVHRGLSRRAAARRAVELLDLVGIDEPALRARQLPHELSGGMRQRAMIAAALAPEPLLLIADEPTTALDVRVQAQIVALLSDLVQEFDIALLLVTHDLGLVAEIADRIAVMYMGRIVESGPAETLLRTPHHPYTQGLLASTLSPDNLPDRLPAIPGEPPDLAALPSGCAFRDRCSFAHDRCREDPPLSVDRDGGTAACWLLHEVALAS